jgi:ketose-bisphosphate aldolase
MSDSAAIVQRARRAGLAVPAFNIPYLPMMEPVIRAVRDEEAFAFIEVARLEWEKFEAVSLRAVGREFEKWADRRHVRLHLDHVPVIDEDGRPVDYLPIIREAIELGYGSVLLDGSRLPLEANIRATAEAAGLAHRAGVACEAELGAVPGHEDDPLPPYEELFRSGRGFTDVEEARRFVAETGCDWLSVAVGNIHGAISAARRDGAKPRARIDLDHLSRLAQAAAVPLVLHGGSGIERETLREAVRRGIAKVNVGTDIRQPYERALRGGSAADGQGGPSAGLSQGGHRGRRPRMGRRDAQEAVYRRTRALLAEYFGLRGTGPRLVEVEPADGGGR